MIDETLPRVSDIVRILRIPEYEAAAAFIPEGAMEAKAEEGTAFHFLAEQFFKNFHKKNRTSWLDIEAYPAAVLKDFQAFMSWADLCIDEVMWFEKSMEHEVLGYRGTPDLCAVIKGQKWPSIIDYKRTVKILFTNYLQVTLYDIMAKHNGDKTATAHLLHIKDGKVKAYPFEPLLYHGYAIPLVGIHNKFYANYKRN